MLIILNVHVDRGDHGYNRTSGTIVAGKSLTRLYCTIIVIITIIIKIINPCHVKRLSLNTHNTETRRPRARSTRVNQCCGVIITIVTHRRETR